MLVKIPDYLKCFNQSFPECVCPFKWEGSNFSPLMLYYQHAKMSTKDDNLAKLETDIKFRLVVCF